MNGTYPIDAEQASLYVRVVLGNQTTAANGGCGQIASGSCTYSKPGTKLVCISS